MARPKKNEKNDNNSNAAMSPSVVAQTANETANETVVAAMEALAPQVAQVAQEELQDRPKTTVMQAANHVVKRQITPEKVWKARNPLLLSVPPKMRGVLVDKMKLRKALVEQLTAIDTFMSNAAYTLGFTLIAQDERIDETKRIVFTPDFSDVIVPLQHIEVTKTPEA